MIKRAKWIWLLTGAAVLGFGAGCSGQHPQATPGKIEPCPDSPNCVSSQSAEPRHRIDPIAFTGSPAEARQKLLEAVGSLPGTRVVTDSGGYLHVEFTSAVFRFVDDVEFLIDRETHLIQVRSASRVGYWDLGANRKRVELIRGLFTRESP
jgi:uncharacterized protein (DUF1499 family)